MDRNPPHPCRCARHSRRGFLRLASSGAGAALFGAAPPVLAAAGCEALLLNCIDYRLQDETTAWMDKLGLRDDYDRVSLAGAALGAVSPKHPAWRVTFSEHLALAIKLHAIKRVILLDHRDCGAYREVLGEAAVRTPQAEFDAHATVMRKLRSRIRKARPHLAVDLGLMALDGSVETIA